MVNATIDNINYNKNIGYQMCYYKIGKLEKLFYAFLFIAHNSV